jgi:hypothetical protein
MYVLYYASTLWCWHLVWILIRTDHPCLGVGCHRPCHFPLSWSESSKMVIFGPDIVTE